MQHIGIEQGIANQIKSGPNKIFLTENIVWPKFLVFPGPGIVDNLAVKLFSDKISD
jgi:hypothetical protein